VLGDRQVDVAQDQVLLVLADEILVADVSSSMSGCRAVSMASGAQVMKRQRSFARFWRRFQSERLMPTTTTDMTITAAVRSGEVIGVARLA
jgi:hypothetical protein